MPTYGRRLRLDWRATDPASDSSDDDALPLRLVKRKADVVEDDEGVQETSRAKRARKRLEDKDSAT